MNMNISINNSNNNNSNSDNTNANINNIHYYQQPQQLHYQPNNNNQAINVNTIPKVMTTNGNNQPSLLAQPFIPSYQPISFINGQSVYVPLNLPTQNIMTPFMMLPNNNQQSMLFPGLNPYLLPNQSQSTLFPNYINMAQQFANPAIFSNVNLASLNANNTTTPMASNTTSTAATPNIINMNMSAFTMPTLNNIPQSFQLQAQQALSTPILQTQGQAFLQQQNQLQSQSQPTMQNTNNNININDNHKTNPIITQGQNNINININNNNNNFKS